MLHLRDVRENLPSILKPLLQVEEAIVDLDAVPIITTLLRDCTNADAARHEKPLGASPRSFKHLKRILLAPRNNKKEELDPQA